jgi:hypothetical protein
MEKRKDVVVAYLKVNWGTDKKSKDFRQAI